MKGNGGEGKGNGRELKEGKGVRLGKGYEKRSNEGYIVSPNCNREELCMK